MKTLEHEVKAVLEPYHDEIYRVIDSAVKKWKEFVERGLPTSDKPLRPKVIQGIMMHEARNAFREVRGVVIIDEPYGAQRSVFNFHGEVVVVFKQLNESFLRANIPTQTVLFADSEGWLPHVGQASFVTAGYRFDLMELDYRAFIARETNKRCDWRYELTPPAASRVVPFAPVGGAYGPGALDQQLPLIPKRAVEIDAGKATSDE